MSNAFAILPLLLLGYQWFRLLEESAVKNGHRHSDSELYNSAVDTLLPLILAGSTTASSANINTLKAYLHQCLQSSEATKRNTLFQILELVRSEASSEQTARACDDVALVLLEGFPQAALPSLPAEYASTALSLLASAATFSLPALSILALTLLCRPVTLDKSLLQPLEAARIALYSVPMGSVISSDQLQLAMKSMNDIERRLDPSVARKRKRPTSLPGELELLLQYILEDHAQQAQRHLKASLRARLAYEEAFGLDSGTAGWLKDLMDVCVRQTIGDKRGAARWRSFAYGVLPRLLRAMEVEIPEELGAPYETLYKWLNAEPQDLATRLPDPFQITPHALMTTLLNVAEDYSAHGSASALVLRQVEAYASNSDLPSLATLLRSLTLAPQVLDFLLLHIAPMSLLRIVEQILSAWDSSDDYGAGQSMELYGSLQLSLWVISSRYSRPFSIPSSVYALEALSHEQQALVSSWITALYGNEGIDDELLRSTHPRIMLALAPTIVHQSLRAHELGIIDTETLQGGLSYFTQDLLNFTVPGLVNYMMERSVGMEFIKSLMPENTPACVLELVDLKEAGQRPMRTGSRNVTSLESVRTVLACQPRNQVVDRILQGQDMLLASALLTLPIVGRPLLDIVTEEYVPRLLKTGSTTEIFDDIADIVALSLLRSGRDVREVRGRELQVAFWERVDSFR